MTESVCYFQVPHMHMYTCVYTHIYIHIFLIVKMEFWPIIFSSWLLLVCREAIVCIYKTKKVYSFPLLVLIAFVFIFWVDNSVSNCKLMSFPLFT